MNILKIELKVLDETGERIDGMSILSPMVSDFGTPFDFDTIMRNRNLLDSFINSLFISYKIKLDNNQNQCDNVIRRTQCE
jgi:hypothetical protein